MNAARETMVNAAVAKREISRIVIARRLKANISSSHILLVGNGEFTHVTEKFDPIIKQFLEHVK